jgi:hypothetical protein
MLLFYFITFVQKIKSMFQVKVAKFLIQPEMGGSILHQSKVNFLQ